MGDKRETTRSDRIDQFFELRDQRGKLEGSRVIGLMNHLNSSLSIYTSNCRDLVGGCFSYENDLSIWNIENRQKLDSLTSEMTRLLHNYLSSVTSLIDHTRVFRKYLDNAEFAKSYEERLQEMMESKCTTFMKKLRNYAHHRSIPFVRARLSFQAVDRRTGQASLDQILFLDKEKLLAWDGWNTSEKEYIESHEGDVELKTVVNEYHELISGFYKWIDEKIRELYHHELSEVAEIDKKMAEICPYDDLGWKREA